MTFPNQLTILRIVLTPIALFLLLSEGTYAIQIATAVFVIASFTDWYDGHIARKYGYTSNWGKFLDPLADKLLILTMLFGFAVLKYIKFLWVIIILLRDIIITFLRSYMIAYGKPMTASRIAKWKTFSQVGLIYALLIFLNIEYWHGADASFGSLLSLSAFKTVIDTYVIFVVLFTVVTGILYLYKNRTPILELLWRAYRFVIPFRLAVNGNSPGVPPAQPHIPHTNVPLKTSDTDPPQSQ